MVVGASLSLSLSLSHSNQSNRIFQISRVSFRASHRIMPLNGTVISVRLHSSPPLLVASLHGCFNLCVIMRTFTTTLWSHAQVAAAFLRMLRNASRTFRAGTGTSGPQSVTCPSGPLNQAADGRRHFYWYLPDIAPFVFWRPRGMFSITSCLPIACHRLWA